jgi:hypothetical protein
MPYQSLISGLGTAYDKLVGNNPADTGGSGLTSGQVGGGEESVFDPTYGGTMPNNITDENAP